MPDREAYAEYAAVSADEVVQAGTAQPRRPPDFRWSVTAWRALFDAGALRDGQRVLVHAAAGGVGPWPSSLRPTPGHVVGTASSENRAYLRELGVDEFVNYREEQFEACRQPVNLVLDAVGGDTLERSIPVLADGGRIVTLPEPPSEAVRQMARQERNATVDWFSVEPDATTLAALCSLVGTTISGQRLAGSYPLSDAATAHQESETATSAGNSSSRSAVTDRREPTSGPRCMTAEVAEKRWRLPALSPIMRSNGGSDTRSGVGHCLHGLQAFSLIGDETGSRFSRPSGTPTTRPVPFSRLYETVETDTSHQFNYHLKRLTGQFVRKTDAGYELRTAGERRPRDRRRVVQRSPSPRAVRDRRRLHQCGSPLQASYDDERLAIDCPACGRTHGVLVSARRPPRPDPR